MKGSEHGIPRPIPKDRKYEVYFEMKQQLNRTFPSKNGQDFRICPVTRLSTVSVQTGYSRQPDMKDDQEPVFVNYKDDINDRFEDSKRQTTTWYPGVINHGEGLFIRLDANDGWHGTLAGNACFEWE